MAEGLPLETRLEIFMRPLPTLGQCLPIRRAIEQLLGERETIALVDDHNARPVGLVTLEDLPEAMLGEAITDERNDTARLQAPSNGHGSAGSRGWSGCARSAAATSAQVTRGMRVGSPSMPSITPRLEPMPP